jgi:hypothetical protein
MCANPGKQKPVGFNFKQIVEFSRTVAVSILGADPESSTLCYPCYNQCHRAVQKENVCKEHELTPTVCAAFCVKRGQYPCSPRILRSFIERMLKTTIVDGQEMSAVPGPLMPLMDTMNTEMDMFFRHQIVPWDIAYEFFTTCRFRNFMYCVRKSATEQHVDEFIQSRIQVEQSP